MDSIDFTRLAPDAVLPVRAHSTDAGLDLYCQEGVSLPPRKGALVRTGVAAAVPAGHVGLVADRSSMARRGLKTAGGVIDAGYRGEIGVILWNLSDQEQVVAKGDRLAQLLIAPIAVPQVREVESLDETARGSGGFGSTGK